MKKSIFSFTNIFFLFFASACSFGQTQTGVNNVFFVSPSGTSNGNGSITKPWDFQTVLDKPSVVMPGDTVWLRAGIYRPPESSIFGFISVLSGSQEKPVIVRNFNGERAIIDGAFDIRAGYIWIWGLEFTTSDSPPSTDLTREEQDALFSDGTLRFSNIEISTGDGIKLVNNVIHGNYRGISWSLGATNSELYGNLIIGNGRLASDLPSGHGVYVQNRKEDGTKRIIDNIVGNNFLNGLNLFSAGTSFVQNILVDGNIIFGNGIDGVPLYGQNIYIEAPNPVSNIHILNNFFYRPSSAAIGGNNGFYRERETTGNDIIINNNVLANSGFANLFLLQLDFTNNIVGPGGEIQLRWPTDSTKTATYTYNDNSYFKINFNPWFYQDSVYGQVNTGATDAGYAEWKSILNNQGVIGADSSSVFSENAPVETKILVRPNLYEPGRANISIINWGNESNIAVDVSAVLSTGEDYRLQSVDDFFGPAIQTGTFDGIAVIIPSNLLGKLKNTDLEFGAFVLLKTAEPVSSPDSIVSFLIESDTASIEVKFTDNSSVSINFLSGNIQGKTLNIVQLNNLSASQVHGQLFSNVLSYYEISTDASGFTAELTFGYTDLLLTSSGTLEDDLAVSFFDSIDSGEPKWHSVPVEIDKINKRVKVTTNHFSLWAVSSKNELLITGVEEDESVEIPLRFELKQNYPNPFNPETSIKYSLRSIAEVTLTIFDISGTQVRILESGVKQAGDHIVVWDGADQSGRQVSTGVYFYRLFVNSLDGRTFTITKKMTVIK